MNDSAITIKGRRPRDDYGFTLLDLFSRASNDVLDRSEIGAGLRAFDHILPGLNGDAIDVVFPPAVVGEGRRHARYPCVMADAPAHKVRRNLLYQDTRIKLAVEDREAKGAGPVDPKAAAEALLQAYALLLRTPIAHAGPAWRLCTDNDLDALTFLLLDRYDPSRRDGLLQDGHRANRNSLEVLEAVVSRVDLPPDLLLEYQIHAGTVWWGQDPPHRISRSELVINDFDRFAREALEGPCRLVFLFDDNGELVWDLKMIQKLLRLNPRLSVTGVVSSQVISNNANTSTLAPCLESPTLGGLAREDRFRVFAEDSIRSAIDPSFCSTEMLKTLLDADLLFIKGVSFFETIQAMETTSYYAFVVHSHDSRICTGLEKGDGVFVRTPRRTAAFDYGKTCLRDLYPVWKASSPWVTT